MENTKDKNLTRFLLTFFLGWIGSIIINATDLKPKGYKSRTLAYIFLTAITFGIYGLVASIYNLYFDPAKESNIGYYKEAGYVYTPTSSEKPEATDGVKETPVQVEKKQNSSFKEQLKNAIAVFMAMFSFITLFYPMIDYTSSGVCGLDFVAFQIEDNFHSVGGLWFVYAINYIVLIASIVLIILAFKNFKKSKKNGKKIAFFALGISVLYLLSCILFANCLQEESWLIIIAYPKGLVIELLLFAVYTLIDKFNLPSVDNAVEEKVEQKVVIPSAANIELVKKLAQLKEEGILTQEEFEEKKKVILG